MKREPIQSASLVSVGYSPCASVLEVELTGGEVRQFLNVPTSVYDALLESPHRDGFFLEHVRERFFSRICVPAPIVDRTLPAGGGL
jgi:hypothetical protein